MKALGIGLLVALLVWVIGFAWFVQIAGRAGQVPPHSDGIVAFTGGADRVETALRLLAEQRGDKLLLSGIGGGAELAELAPRAGVDPLPLASRVTLGRSATTTRGNAQETAAWARANEIHSLLVVTAAYHMPRALAELSRALPDVALYPLPVLPPERTGYPAVPLRLIAEEYVKYLATQVGLTAVIPPREAPAQRVGHAG
ncbi:MAG: YdcF family protein [Acetobacteraceae bacterium]|jgi:uncharacterized SAM-binding protein YcdF (DUF218 family)